jgi:hypothetical protein
MAPGQSGANPYLPYPMQPYGGMPMPMHMPMQYGYPSGAPPTYDYANQAQYPPQQQPQQQGAPGYPGYYPYYNPAYPYAPPRPY